MRPKCRAGIAHHAGLLQYDFGPYHPLRPERITASLELLEAADLWMPEIESIHPRESPGDDLTLVHDPEYVRAVDEAGSGFLPHSQLGRFGLTAGDNPAFPGMHDAAAIVSGATVDAAKAVMNGRLDHAFSPAGGLHHALRARASGFCIYNDPAVAAAVVRRDFGARVFYVDFDCHHGDGVQWMFYSDPNVMTVSMHESGRFLFPGTGEVHECGEGDGIGYSVNMPFSPFTRDEQWQEAMYALLPALVERFRPDLIISNHGCDTHAWDPLTHLSLTTSSFVAQAKLVHELAHTYCGGRLLSVGSGGYDWRRVVPRSWAILWSEISGRPVPEMLPERWRTQWTSEPDDPMPTRFLDGADMTMDLVKHSDIENINRETIRSALQVAGLA